MTEWKFTAAENASENQRSLQRLIRAIALSKGQFALILVRCNYRQLREQMLENLRSLTQDIYLREIFLSTSVTALHATIASELFLDNPAVITDCLPSAVMVFGLETVSALEDLLIGINQARDIYADSFPFPLILWLKDEVATLLSKLAPDFRSWAATTIKFEMAKEDLIALIKQQTESLFANILAAGAEQFLSNAALDLDPKSQQRHEIESARHDLQTRYGVNLEPELEASLEFVLGRDRYANDEIEEALDYFQHSLELWQLSLDREMGKTGGRGISSSHHPTTPSPHLLRQAVVLFHQGLCYRRMAELRPALNRRYWQDALFWFRQCLEVLEKAERQDLVAKFILSACEMLQRLQAWKDLKELALKSLELHRVYGDKAQVAQDYGFLAAVAASESNWTAAHELANSALSIAEEAPKVSRQQESSYLLLLGRTQRQMGEWEEAVNNLEWAKVVCEPQYEPSLYLEIVDELRSLYFFERHDYLEAFNLKQEKIKIEHQYGFRAFIGASQLQPQRYRLNSAFQSQTSTNFPEEIAQEIAASGRQQDINRLIERITRADCKLTVIHGPSGVGKSSILKAGLVPALKQTTIGERNPLPIVLSVYTDWQATLGHSLNQAIAQTEITISSEFSHKIIIEQLQSLTDQNYTIILILDQFEEFFFVNKNKLARIKFYQFFSECLDIAFVKIILSLREDYLHYLLELERLCNQNNEFGCKLDVINKNILDKDIRYYLGKFSRKDAIGVIQSLNQRSYYGLSHELINQIVHDLAGEFDEVHPIELQIVCAQLQTENITTIEEYKRCGGSKKLVQRWLEEVIKDCGRENEQLSWQLLFELTDEKGTRPIKTKVELVATLVKEKGGEVGKLAGGQRTSPRHPISPDRNSHHTITNIEMILDILVGSGLVLQVKEESGDRYQLVHDYLVEPIRQKKKYGMVAELAKVRFEKTRAEVAQKLSQEQLNLVLQKRLREARIAGLVLAMMAATIAGLWWQADLQKRAAIRETRRAERSETNLKISAITASSEALFASNKEFDALLESLRAWRRLKQANGVEPDTRMRVVTALQQAVYGVTELNRLEGHNDIIWGIAFSPDGKLLASGSRDRTVKLWRPNGTLLQTLDAHSDAITGISFSPDGKTLASTSRDKTVKIWHLNPTTGKFDPQADKILQGHRDWIFSVAFSPDGKLLATSSKDRTVKLWHRDGKLIKTLLGHQGWVNWVSFSPNGQFLASASDDKTVKIWRRDGKLVKTLLANEEGVTALAFSPNAQVLATAGRDKTVKLWRLDKNGKNGYNFHLDKTLQQHNTIVWNLNFSSDSQQLACAGDDNSVYLWKINEKGEFENRPYKTFKGHSDAVVSVVFSPDQKLLASASYDKTVRLWSLNAPTLPVLQGHKDRVLSVAWSHSGELLASGSKDHTVKLWQRDPNSGRTRLYKTLAAHTDRVPSVSFDPKNQMLASGSYDKTVKLWSLDGHLLKTLHGHSDSVMSVSFSPDGELLASGSKDQTVKLWNREGRLVKTLVGHHGWVNSVSFSPDSQILASASDDQTVKLWGKDGNLLKTFSPHDSWVLGVSFSPTDHLLASASWDNTVRLWRSDGRLLKTLLKGYSDSVNSVTFSPNGEILAAAGWDSTVKLWSHDGKLIKTLNGHHAPVLSVSFSPDSQTLASAGDDNTIILWNLDMNNLLSRGCNWVNNYLRYNRNVDQHDRSLCYGVKS
ncbi:hypothetical protein CBP10_20910 [Fischerella thermalis WC558]|uniref:WD40 domain-containing protein n=1 Tax=Fischerella thermalis TaxID=372787 RepID=UPI000C7F9C6C|nr:PD40 domain-containing protein [Fischerella thermalis]PLZ26589.1 hypothetical protein CBP10_20910 [Fischerella thermalis WC558]PLZ61510.1 hypothetical protein CBP24_03720 [Fischerella thermalis WC439]